MSEEVRRRKALEARMAGEMVSVQPQRSTQPQLQRTQPQHSTAQLQRSTHTQPQSRTSTLTLPPFSHKHARRSLQRRR